jgi:protein phosphatase
MLDVTFGQATDPGRVRTGNEDSMGVFAPISPMQTRSHGWLFVVADGVGGMDYGEVASLRAVETLITGFSQAQSNLSPQSLLSQLIQQANAAVYNEASHPKRHGKQMATTVVCCAMRYDHAWIAHVGDSRCYLVREGWASSITRDHTWVSEQRMLGLISSMDADESESRHVLTRSLGPQLFVSAEISELVLRPKDILVLCSDGLYGGLEDGDIARLASQDKDAQEIAEELVRYALQVDGLDNTTAQVVKVHSVESMAMYRGRPYSSDRS